MNNKANFNINNNIKKIFQLNLEVKKFAGKKF